MTRNDKKNLACNLYLETDFDQKQIAEIVKVTPKTLTKWKNDGYWESLKAARTITKENIVSNTFTMLYNMDTMILQRTDMPYPTAGEADTMSKLSAKIDNLDKRLNLGTYASTLKEFLGWLISSDIESAKDYSKLMMDFLQVKAKELSE